MSLLLKALKQSPISEEMRTPATDVPQMAMATATATAPPQEAVSKGRAPFPPLPPLAPTSASAVFDAPVCFVNSPDDAVASLDLGEPWSVEMLEPSAEEYNAFITTPEAAAMGPSPVVEVSAATEIETPANPRVVAEAERMLPPIERLESLKKLLLDIETTPPKESANEPAPAALLGELAETEPAIATEYRELVDHLLSKFPATKPFTLLFIDAGRTANDASWLVPVGLSMLQSLPARSNGGSASTQFLKKVLVVDFANTGIARQMGLKSELGWTDVLQGAATWESAIYSSGHSGLDILPHGQGTTDCLPNELLQRWSHLQKQYAGILVAAGPWLMPTDFRRQAADQLLPIADAVALCVELDSTPRPIVEATKRELTARGTKLLGCIVRGDATAAS